MNGKRGLSQVISTVLLILLTLAVIGGVWAAVNAYVNSNLSKAGACSDVLGKVSLNAEYTCYDPSSQAVLISVARGEIEINALLVSVSEGFSSKGFTLEKNAKTIENVLNYNTLTASVSLPGNESGRTYCFFGFNSIPSSVEIAPKVRESQCQVVDSVDNIPLCQSGITCSGNERS